MIASRLGVPVVPVRIEGLDKVLHPTWKMARPGPGARGVRRAAAAGRRRLRGARAQVEDAVKDLVTLSCAVRRPSVPLLGPLYVAQWLTDQKGMLAV